MKIAFQMEPMDQSVRDRTNSLAFIQEANKRGYDVYHYEPQTVQVFNGGVTAWAARVSVNLTEDQFYSLERYEQTDLTNFDIVWMRNHPPFDTNYLTYTYLLEILRDKYDVYVTNNPKSVRDVTEKISIFNFEEFIPATLVSRDKGLIKAFLEKHKTIILKPLYHYGSIGITKTSVMDDVEDALNTYPEPLMIQEFLPGIRDGKKRVLLFDGEISGAIIRKPKPGEYLTPSDTQDLPCELTQDEVKLCATVGAFVKDQNIDLAGLDLVDSKLIEINVTCVGGILELNKVYGGHHEVRLWDVIERKLAAFRSR